MKQTMITELEDLRQRVVLVIFIVVSSSRFLIFCSLFIQKELLQDGSGPIRGIPMKLVCIRVTKENRTAGILENHTKGERYAEHSLRKFVRNKAPQIMPSINGFFSDPKY